MDGVQLTASRLEPLRAQHYLPIWKMHYSREKKRGGRGVRIMEFPGVGKEIASMWNFQGLIKYKVEFPSKSDQEKLMKNFHGFLVLEFPSDLTQFGATSRGGALFCLVFPGVKLKVKDWQIPQGFSKKNVLDPVWFFSG